MRISQAFKLGHKSIIGHKRRNFTTIVIISLLFGLLSGVILCVQGMQNALLRAADETYGDAYYVGLMTNFYDRHTCREDPIPGQPNSFNIICPESTLEESVQRVQAAGGEIISASHHYQAVASPAQLSSFISADLQQLPANAYPLLIIPELAYAATHPIDTEFGPAHQDFSRLTASQRASYIRNELPQIVGTTIQASTYGLDTPAYVAGIIPSATIISLSEHPEREFNPFDLLLSLLSMNRGSNLHSIYLDVDSPVAQQEIAQLAEQNSFAENIAFILARFSDAATAQKFVSRDVCGTSSSDCSRPFLIGYSFDNRIDLYDSGRFTWSILSIAETIFIVIASIIMLFTFLKVLGNQSDQIRLYRSLGASAADICLIYAAYLLEVCLYALVFMFIIGLSISGLATLLNASAFSDVLTVAYGRTFTWPIVFIGWNPDLLKFAYAMLAVAALSLLWFILSKKYQKSL